MGIQLLNQETINKIAAGEVVERPMAVVKELVENAIDAGANAVTIEIKDGGTSFIRITDNGYGIEKEEIPIAFQKHSTSKIRNVEDLTDVKSLGFRGEALASIAAVSKVELVTKTAKGISGTRYLIEGGNERLVEDVGSPEGSTFIVRDLFFNVPARRKFLKTAATEAGYILDVVERIAISHPNLSFKFIQNGEHKLQTSGNGNVRDIIYHVYGRDVAMNLIEVEARDENVQIGGLIGKPVISRGNRNYMNYFVNGRYVKSGVVNRAIEDAYKGYNMSHRYPFTALMLNVDGTMVDVNVHPTKMEVRFGNPDETYRMIRHTLVNALKGVDLVPDMAASGKASVKPSEPVRTAPEPFEINRKREYDARMASADPDGDAYRTDVAKEYVKEPETPYEAVNQDQRTLFEDVDRQEDKRFGLRIVGQVFSTYWVIEYEDQMFLMDQHAAHERILYEKLKESMENDAFHSQMVRPPMIVTLSMREEEAWKRHRTFLRRLGFEVEPFGGREFAINGVPADLPDLANGEWFLALMDALLDTACERMEDAVLETLASLSCKAAIKGNRRYSLQEAESLIHGLMRLDNPYHCPHGRPTMIRMDKREIEKRFKRV